LHLLAANPGPLGSGTLMEQLHDLGYDGSEPTVGRFLRTLDRRGLTTRVSNRGRHLTDAGRRHLQHLCEADAQRFRERELIRTIRTTTIDDLLDVLVARRALERETARLAAEHATAEEIAQLEAAIEEQRQALATSGVAIDADVRFHALLAQAARNRVLAAAIDLIRRDKQLTVALDAILKQTEHTWVVGHERILTAIKRRSPAAAERAMLEHINSVIADIRRYGDRLAPAPPVTEGDGHILLSVGELTERRG
jgi:GntR family transcriptional repressor for pyruvate dehydrogenase complex